TVLRDPQAAARRADGEPLAGLVDRQAMAPDQVIGVVLGQALVPHLEAAAAVAGAGNDDFAVHRNATLVLDRGDEPGGIRVDRVRGGGKAEFRRADRSQFAPCRTRIFRAEDAVVVLAPHDLGIRGAAREPVNVPAPHRPAPPPGSSTQILPSDQGWGSSPASTGFGGSTGAASSRQPPERSRAHSLAPKWPKSSAAQTEPSASANTAETG